MHKCNYQTRGGTIRQIEFCGKPAKWSGPRGEYLCGIHRRVIDRVWKDYFRGASRKCTPLEATGPTT